MRSGATMANVPALAPRRSRVRASRAALLPLAGLLVLGGVDTAAGMCTTTGICTVVGSDCQVTAQYSLDNNCTLDFTQGSTAGKRIVVTKPGKLLSAATGYNFSIRAAELKIQGTLQALGGQIAIATVGGSGLSGAVTAESVSNSPGKIDVHNGGSVRIIAVGPVSLNAADVNADGAAGGAGGSISVTGTSITHSAALRAEGKSGGRGGSIELIATGSGSITVDGTIAASAEGTSGGTTPFDGGTVFVHAGGAVTVNKNITAKSVQDGDGGSVDFVAGGAATIAGNHNVAAVGNGGGASGGRISVVASSALLNGTWTATGNYGGRGGTVEIETSAAVQVTQTTFSVDVSGGGQGGSEGGSARISAGTSIGFAGSIVANAGGDGADAGTIELVAKTLLNMTGSLEARTTTNNANVDGVIELTGCDVYASGGLNTRNQVSEPPDGGRNVLRYGTTLVQGGNMLANDGGGGNLVYCACADAAPADGICDGTPHCAVSPMIAGAVTPAATVVVKQPMVCN